MRSTFDSLPIRLAFKVLLLCFGVACAGEESQVITNAPERVEVDEQSPKPAWKLVETSASNPTIFTQGLELHGNRLYQSSGLYQKSFLQHRPYPAPDRSISPEGEVHPSLLVTGGVQRNRFAEGLTVFNGELFLLTWRSGDVFLYNPDTLAPQGKLSVYGEGWGLTNDGESLIMSNGSEELRWLNPKNLKIRKRVKVKNADGSPEKSLNELEYINGEVFANVWRSDKIVRIDPETGVILQTLDMSELWPKKDRPFGVDVLNGIAWDSRNDSLLVTGKRWPALYRIKLRDAPGSLLAKK